MSRPYSDRFVHIMFYIVLPAIYIVYFAIVLIAWGMVS